MSDNRKDQTTAGVEQADQSKASRREFLGVAAALSAPLMLGAMEAQAQSVTSSSDLIGSTDLLDPMTPAARRDTAYQKRVDAAVYQRNWKLVNHKNNGDEKLYNSKIGSFTKGLPHNQLGEVDSGAYAALTSALSSGSFTEMERVPIGSPDPATQRPFVCPQSGYAFSLTGRDSHSILMPPAPAFASAQTAGEMVELYWAALCRDVPFTEYDTHPLTNAAAAELSSLSDFRGPKVGGAVTTGSLFRMDLPGALKGPYASQFMLLPVPYGVQGFDQLNRTHAPGSSYMTNYDDWLSIQRGIAPIATDSFDGDRRYVFNSRGLASYTQIDALAQAYFNAAVIMGTPIKRETTQGKNAGFGGIGAPLDPQNPYVNARRQEPFGTFGGPWLLALLWEASGRAIKAQWFQKWLVHRRLRPEVFGGRVHNHLQRNATYPIHSDVLNARATSRIRAQQGTYLLPTTFPEGSPTHPAYGSGHACVAGACVTVLKAFFDESYVIPEPVVASADGLSLLPYSGAALTVGGELNKLAANVCSGRLHAGMHWYSDNYQSMLVGEAVALSLLAEQKGLANEPFQGFTLTKFDGSVITI